MARKGWSVREEVSEREDFEDFLPADGAIPECVGAFPAEDEVVARQEQRVSEVVIADKAHFIH